MTQQDSEDSPTTEVEQEFAKIEDIEALKQAVAEEKEKAEGTGHQA